jgi:uncharacterized LabA/DUF88 family protein
MKTNNNLPKEIRQKNNQAFIDAQNLHLGTTKSDDPWKVDLIKFRVYLQKKFHVNTAYYFLGVYDIAQNQMYKAIQEAGYILIFREHGLQQTGNKKGNVDTDIVFTIMQQLLDVVDFDNVVLVSGDGDYFKMVDYLIKKNRFETLLIPRLRGMSSLYKRLPDRHKTFLDTKEIKRKIGYLKENK